MAAKRIGILTGGGDVPGLNSVIKTVVYRGSEIGCEVIGIRRGWEGLTHVNLDDPASQKHYILPLDRENTRDIENRGGTILHSSRTNPSKMKSLPEFLQASSFPTDGKTWDVTSQVVKNLERLGIDALIVIGGDDTLSFAAHLDSLGVPIIGVSNDATRYFDYHHSADDTLANVDRDQLNQNVAVWASLVYLIAESGIDFRSAPAAK